MSNSDEEANAKNFDYLLELQSSMFNRAAAYTNIILVGGYAGAFTIWNFTRSQLTPRATIVVALFLSISLVTFIAFEVFKMIWTAVELKKQVLILRTAKSPTEF